jgi:hypothetical protein
MSGKRPFTFGNEVIADQVKEIDRLTKRYQEAKADADRFVWWFSADKSADFLAAYMTGMREDWSLDKWRQAIDKAREKGK